MLTIAFGGAVVETALTPRPDEWFAWTMRRAVGRVSREAASQEPKAFDPAKAEALVGCFVTALSHGALRLME